MVAAALRQTCVGDVHGGPPADGAVDAVIGRGNGALDHHQVLAFVLFDHAIQERVGVSRRRPP